ncbi:MAG: hypothetical protein ACPIOQ_35365, partial [Promethearchaeia archaeon]
MPALRPRRRGADSRRRRCGGFCSRGQCAEVITSKNGCRRVDVPGDGEYAKHGWVKLMEQNKNKGSAAAKRARGVHACPHPGHVLVQQTCPQHTDTHTGGHLPMMDADGSNIVWILPLEKDGKHPPH